ncbi:uncharacterized protein [Argopecten irradians]|uniref:uncharacterized protein n=1 Tax=Argopecten irradians TaxID=31199 RepID=UPI0037228000
MELQRLDSISLKEEYLLKIWEDYVLENIVEANSCQMAIFDRRTKRRIIGTDNFKIQACELSHIAEGVLYPDLVYRNGITACGRHYDVRLADGKQGIYARAEEYGCTVCRTQSLLIICINDSRAVAAECNEQVMKLGDFLFQAGM